MWYPVNAYLANNLKCTHDHGQTQNTGKERPRFFHANPLVPASRPAVTDTLDGGSLAADADSFGSGFQSPPGNLACVGPDLLHPAIPGARGGHGLRHRQGIRV
ncbi:hypothetical protein DESC_710047 [Desulfosarcina cetonica]|nr:hypothetical protein DESC_710047 [Desulfosarcina cetonica]